MRMIRDLLQHFCKVMQSAIFNNDMEQLKDIQECTQLYRIHTTQIKSPSALTSRRPVDCVCLAID